MHTHTHTHASMHVCTHARMHARTHARTHTHIHTHTHTHTHVRMHMHVRVFVCICMCDPKMSIYPITGQIHVPCKKSAYWMLAQIIYFICHQRCFLDLLSCTESTQWFPMLLFVQSLIPEFQELFQNVGKTNNSALTLQCSYLSAQYSPLTVVSTRRLCVLCNSVILLQYMSHYIHYFP